MTIKYLNTDLDLEGEAALTDLTTALENRGLHSLHVERSEDGRWHARFETNTLSNEAESHIGVMLDAIESLDGNALEAWKACAIREFNIGYNSGVTPRVLESGLSNVILRRIVDVGARVGISIYSVIDD